MSALATVPRETSEAGQRLEELPLSSIDVGENVRVDAGDMGELVASIAELGVLQPVRAIGPNKAGRYRLVWGQRRYLACSQLGLPTIPALVEPTAEADKPGARRSIEQLAENLIRKDLNAIEEAVALREILDSTKGLTQDALAKRLGMSAPWVANTLVLLDAAPSVQKAIIAGELSAAHGKVLARLPKKEQVQVAQDAINFGTSAHDLEARVRRQRENAEREKHEEQKLATAIQEVLGRLLHGDDPYPLEATIYGLSWGGHAPVLQKWVQALGWKFKTDSYWARPSAKVCDCTAIAIEIDYSRRVQVKKVCIVRDHATAKQRADETKREEHGKAQSERRRALVEVLEQKIRATPGDRMVVRLTLWALLGDYRRVELAKRLHPTVKKADPWAAIAGMDDAKALEQLVTCLIDSTSSWQNDAPLEGMIAAFGVASPVATEPPATPPAKAKGKAPKFTASQAAAAAAEMDAEGLT